MDMDKILEVVDNAKEYYHDDINGNDCSKDQALENAIDYIHDCGVLNSREILVATRKLRERL